MLHIGTQEKFFASDFEIGLEYRKGVVLLPHGFNFLKESRVLGCDVVLIHVLDGEFVEGADVFVSSCGVLVVGLVDDGGGGQRWKHVILLVFVVSHLWQEAGVGVHAHNNVVVLEDGLIPDLDGPETNHLGVAPVRAAGQCPISRELLEFFPFGVGVKALGKGLGEEYDWEMHLLRCAGSNGGYG